MRRYQQKLRRYQQMLEQRPQVAFLLQAARRFKEIEGKHLALVISLNLFIAVIPLLIIIYAFAEAFSPHRSFGALVVKDLHLTGSSALIVRDTFTSASSGKSVALSISLISLLITGLDVSATAQLAYARAFSMTRCEDSHLPPAAAGTAVQVAGSGARRGRVHRRRCHSARRDRVIP
ncbi:MAG: hypothetical protein ACTHPS_12485, partial [Streptosporangiaceae bacterium]